MEIRSWVFAFTNYCRCVRITLRHCCQSVTFPFVILAPRFCFPFILSQFSFFVKFIHFFVLVRLIPPLLLFRKSYSFFILISSHLYLFIFFSPYLSCLFDFLSLSLFFFPSLVLSLSLSSTSVAVKNVSPRTYLLSLLTFFLPRPPRPNLPAHSLLVNPTQVLTLTPGDTRGMPVGAIFCPSSACVNKR